MDMTATAIIDAAYRKGGISDPTTAQDTAGLQDLQNMLSSWSAEGLAVPWYTTEDFTLTIGQDTYTIGVTGDSPDLVTATGRPLKIVDAWIVLDSRDYPIDVTMSKLRYGRIFDKTKDGRPRKLYYDPQYPKGTIQFDFEPDVAYALTLVSEKVLVQPASGATTFSLPLEYNEAIIYNLAIRLSIDEDMQLPREVFAIAELAKDNLERQNATDKLSDPVVLDSAVTYQRYNNAMDINSGGFV